MPRRSTKYIVVHVTATPPHRDIGVKEVDAMHRKRGFNGCGYHYVIRRNGKVEAGRAENAVGAHVRGFNSVSLGVSLVGGVDRSGKPQDNRTPEQNAALLELLQKLTKKYRRAKICGHRDLSPDRDGDGVIESHEYVKACPCFDAIPWARRNGLPGADIKGVWAMDTIIPPEPPDARKVYLQKLLKRAGYEFGPVDGDIGPKTKDAIRRFQAAAGLKTNGLFDKATVARLRAMFERDQEIIVEKKVQAELDKAIVALDPMPQRSTHEDIPEQTQTPGEEAKSEPVNPSVGWAGVFAAIRRAIANFNRSRTNG